MVLAWPTNLPSDRDHLRNCNQCTKFISRGSPVVDGSLGGGDTDLPTYRPTCQSTNSPIDMFKSNNIRVVVIFALLSFSRKLPSRENKISYAFMKEIGVLSWKIIPTWNVLPTFSRNFSPAKITTFTVYPSIFEWKLDLHRGIFGKGWVEWGNGMWIYFCTFILLLNIPREDPGGKVENVSSVSPVCRKRRLNGAGFSG